MYQLIIYFNVRFRDEYAEHYEDEDYYNIDADELRDEAYDLDAVKIDMPYKYKRTRSELVKWINIYKTIDCFAGAEIEMPPVGVVESFDKEDF